jgi:hypothetical protein
MKGIPETYLMKGILETYLMKGVPETYLMKGIPETGRVHLFLFYHQLEEKRKQKSDAYLVICPT